MATIYRFVIEQKTTQSSGRKDSSGQSKGTTAKKGRSVSFFGGDKGGVEHNRKMRAINPLLNKITYGYWEKGMRLGRAGLGLVKNIEEKGAGGIFSGPAIYIIIALIIQTMFKIQNREIQRAEKLNAQNYKAMENGFGAVHGQYKVTTNFWTGRTTYNENK